MRPGSTGWLQVYFNKVSEITFDGDTDRLFQMNLHNLSQEKQLYGVIQPTGLMYGHPVKVLRDYGYNMKYWSQRQKMNLVLSDSFINRALLLKRDEISNKSDLLDVLHFSVKELVEFYQYTQNGKFSGLSLKRKVKSDLDIAERIIDQRLVTTSASLHNFWSRFFYNSLLFIDVYYYGQWIRKHPDGEKEDFDKGQEKMRLNLLKTIASAANADRLIKKAEKKLFDTFLISANLKKEMREEARDFLHSGTSIDEIDFTSLNSWITKKYFMELAVLTIWSDKEVNESEELYLDELRIKLGLSEDELAGSMVAIESFVLTNWDQVYFLQKNHAMLMINFHGQGKLPSEHDLLLVLLRGHIL